MKTPESVLKFYAMGAITSRAAATVLVGMIDDENVDQIMRSLPPTLFREMRIEAGFEDRDQLLEINAPPPAEPFRVAALLTWLAKNGVAPLLKLPSGEILPWPDDRDP